MAISPASAVTQAAAVSAAARVALAEASLQLQIGQVLEALVVGKTPAGLTQLKIGDTLVQAQLPQPVAQGTVLRLEVKADGPPPQLVIVEEGAPQQPMPVPQLAPRPAVPLSVPLVVAEGSEPEAPALAQQQPVFTSRVLPQQVSNPQAAIVESSQTPAAVASQPASSASAIPVSDAPTPHEVGATPQLQQVPTAPMQMSNRGTAPTTEPSARVVTTPASEPAATVSAAAQLQTAAPSASSQPLQQAVPVSSPRPEAGAIKQPATLEPPTQTANHPEAPTQTLRVSSPPPQQHPPTLAAAPEAPVQSPLLVAQEAARPATNALELPRAVATPQPQSGASQPPPLPPTPEAALAQMMPGAMAKQDSIAPLLLSLAALVARPVALPAPLLKAALQVLAQRVIAPDGKITTEVLESAVAKSGVFLEANLAKNTPLPGDGKTALLALRAAAEKLLGGVLHEPAPAANRAPPPVRGLPPRAVPVEQPALPDAPREITRSIHQQADAAVSRVKLLQLASLPDAAAPRAASPEVRLELPFLIGHELVMAQLQIVRDGNRRNAEHRRGWTMRFALNFSTTGEVGAEVGLLGKTVNVALWAAEPETAGAFAATLPQLTGALEAIGLKPASVRVRRGPPQADNVPSGQLLDAMS